MLKVVKGVEAFRFVLSGIQCQNWNFNQGANYSNAIKSICLAMSKMWFNAAGR